MASALSEDEFHRMQVVDTLDTIIEQKREPEIIGIRDMITAKNTVSAICILGDLLVPVNIFSKYLQGSVVDFSEVSLKLKELTDTLHAMVGRFQATLVVNNESDLLFSKLDSLFGVIDERTVYTRRLRDHDVYTARQIVEEIATPMTLGLINEIEDSFHCSPVLKAFSVLNLQQLPDTILELDSYGKADIATLAGHYGAPKEDVFTGHRNRVPALLDGPRMTAEFSGFKHHMFIKSCSLGFLQLSQDTGIYRNEHKSIDKHGWLQLIELRTAKYELESVNKKQEREIQILKDAAETTEKELQKAQKAINKSKKAKEVELLMQEADNLQMKLQSQEDDFRVQNQTLMQELTNLVSSNEELEKQVSELKENKGGQSGVSQETSHLEDEIRRLQAQNSALQRSMSELQSKTSSKSESKSEATTDNAVETSEAVNTESDDATVDVDTLQKTIDDLKLCVDTEAEEKKMIKQKLTENEEKHAKEVKNLKEEMEKVTEKLKKKQESYVQLQKEKESSFEELNAKLIEIHSSKDRDQKYYTDQIAKLQQEIAKYQRLQEEIKSNSDYTLKQLQNKMAQMQQQINAADIIENQHLQERTQKYESHAKELQSQILVLTQKRDDLSAQLEESERVSQMASQQLLALQQERDREIQSAQEANKLAEKRKAMLDELAIEYQKDGDKHREQMLTMENDYESQLKTLRQKLDQEQKKSVELEKLKPMMEEKQTEISSLLEKCGWLERKLTDTEGSLDKTLDENETTILTMTTDHEEEVTSLKTAHSTEIDNLTSTFQAEINSLKESDESQKQVIASLEEEGKKLKQEIKDSVNERKVHEKKGKSVLKDLKKQLHAERKRGDKLQERLQEVLSNGSHNKSIEDLFRAPDMMSDSWREDQSSISSWSGGGTLASYATNPSVMSTSPHSSPMSPSTEFPGQMRNGDGLETENKELLARIAAVQQEKWDLEEKVQHLETGTSAMANDLIEKSKIIEHYVMESRTDMKHHNNQPDEKITLKKVLDLVNKSDEHGLREMNKKLQNMLEETLTKNMHLQKDLETMSQEIVRLSKIPHQVSANMINTDKHSAKPSQDSAKTSNNSVTDEQRNSESIQKVNGAVS